jgi:hypothetical protein
MGEGLRPLPHAGKGYMRVRFFEATQGREKTVILAGVRETATFITGIEVDKEGDEVHGAGFDERRRVIAKSTIRGRVPMRMDNKYATLVVDTQGFIDLGGGWRAEKAENAGPRGGRVGVFNAWHESDPANVLTFEKLRSARAFAQDHGLGESGPQI